MADAAHRSNVLTVVLTGGKITQATYALEVRQLEIHYGARATIGPISVAVRPASVLGLIGTNGSGKTSIMRVMCGLQQLDAGEVQVFGRPVQAGLPVPGLGAMIEEPRFYPWLSAAENLRLASGGREEWNSRIPSALERVGLSQVAGVPVGEFSQGMRQRLGFARALMGEPKLLVLDEPTNGLDAESIAQMRGVLRSLAAQEAAIVVASHLISEIQEIADDVLVLSAGQVLVYSATSDIVSRWGSVSRMYERVVARL